MYNKMAGIAISLGLLAAAAAFSREGPQGAPQQEQGPQSQAGPSIQVQAQPAARHLWLRKVVAFLTVECQDGNQVVPVRGTAFFVSVEDKRLGDKRGFTYLVTNRHMTLPEKDGQPLSIRKISLRLNLKAPIGGSHSEEVVLPLEGGMRWYFPTDASVDLAVMPLHLAEERYDYVSVPDYIFATTDTFEWYGIGEGQEVLFAGFFYQFPGQKRIEPIIRQGVLAMVPDEEITTTLHRPGRLYLADVHVFGGNSGAPLFAKGAFRGRDLGGGKFSTGSFPLLGVVSGYIYETQDLHLKVATTLTGRANANSGISTIVPADELKALLDSAELRRLRDEQVERERK